VRAQRTLSPSLSASLEVVTEGMGQLFSVDDGRRSGSDAEKGMKL
jgi:hypothetical protein